VQCNADERRHVDFVSNDEVGSLFQRSDETQEEDLVADELTEQRQAVVQAAVSTSTTVLRSSHTHKVLVSFTTQRRKRWK